MFKRLAHRLTRSSKQIRSGAIFLCLAAVGLCGHVTHWDFARLVGGRSDAHDIGRASSIAAEARPAADFKSGHIQLASAQTAVQMGISLARVEQQRLNREIVAPARVTYEQTRLAQLTSRAPGTLWRSEKRVGDPIRQGEVLAIIDSIQVGKAKADLLHALADVDLKRKVFNRLVPLENVVAHKQIEQAESELRKARFDLFNAQQTLVNLGLAVDPNKLTDLADDELLRYVKFLGLPNSVAATLDPNNSTANLLPLVAPFDGIVIHQDSVKGEAMSTLENGFEIADISRMQIRLSIRDEDSSELRLGQQVIFRSGQNELTTAISWISTEVDAKARTIEVRCDTDNPRLVDAHGRAIEQRMLRANMFGNARICLEERPGALVVPTAAVQSSGEEHVVFVRSGDTAFEVRSVDIGIATADLTEILDGLSPGEQVASEGSHVLKAERARLEMHGEHDSKHG